MVMPSLPCSTCIESIRSSFFLALLGLQNAQVLRENFHFPVSARLVGCSQKEIDISQTQGDVHLQNDTSICILLTI